MSSPEKPIPDYKTTIKLPTTDFPMKGDLPQREPKTIESWEQKQIYHKILEKNKNRQSFILPDGPPYANGNIHIGHALNKILKDTIIKYKNMSGFCAPFIPGWDCHGLPIEHKVTKELSDKARKAGTKVEASDQEIMSLCRAEAQGSIEVQRNQFRRLGILAEWERPYLTMQPEYEAEEIREFARAFKKGVIYRGAKPVYWNWVLKTALAEAEVEYHDHKSPSIYVKFEVKDAKTLEKLGNPNLPTSIVIWTTTPWTLPANLGICLHPEFEYGVYTSNNLTECLVIAKGLKDNFEKATGLSLQLFGETFSGATLERGRAQHPFIDRSSLLILGDHVSLDAGTGCVHTAPGHGADDFKVGNKYNLGVLSPVDDAGCFTDEVPEFAGINIFKANPLIIEKIRQSGHLIQVTEIQHSYPHCWRSKTPLIFRTTPQWFLSLDDEKTQVRQKCLEEISKVKFFPSWGEVRFRTMMEGRPDWCLSRQRLWGVPIPVFYCVATGEPLADYNVMMKVADVIEKEGGIDAFYKHDSKFFIGDVRASATIEGKALPAGFGSQGFKHGKDILDVWFDSGICHAAVQRRRELMKSPADLYLEGSDQHRGWFNTSLISSVATAGVSPFKSLVTHGFVTDPQGRKMSKSLGNVVDPQEVNSKSGAEILRLWTIYEDYGKDITCGTEVFSRISETYRRIRNTVRFLLGALHDFEPEKHEIAYDKLTDLDKWALHELYNLNQKVIAAYDQYEFYKIYHLLNNFFTVTLSATYLDILKDRLYTWKADGLPRRSSQTVLQTMIRHLILMMAPVLTFLAEETYTYLKGAKKESVLLEDFPIAPEQWKQVGIATIFEKIWIVRTDVQKQLEELRALKTIGSSLEAKVTVVADGDVYSALKTSGKSLRELFIVSEVELNSGAYSVKAEKAAGEKCVRCWTYSVEIGANKNLPGICPKCVEALT